MDIDVEMTIRNYIPEVLHMTLATAHDNIPWVFEEHFAYDDDLNLYFRSLTSRRHSQEIMLNPHVSGNIVKQHVLEDSATGVFFEGTAKLLEPGVEQDKAYECIKGRLKVDDNILEEAKHENGHQFYKISVDNWYVFGWYGGPSGQKHQLAWKDGKKADKKADNI